MRKKFSNFKWISGTEFKELNEFCTEWDKPEKWTELENKILDENSKILGVKSLPAMNLANPAMKVKQSKKRKRSEKIKSESPKAKMSKFDEIPKSSPQKRSDLFSHKIHTKIVMMDGKPCTSLKIYHKHQLPSSSDSE